MVGIGPDGSGRFHPTATAQLEEVGAWLKVNGEGIFNSRPRAGGGWKDGDTVRLIESEDGAFVYAYLLQRPTRPITLRSVRATPGAKIFLLGHDQPLSWRPTADGITADFPAAANPAIAYALKIETPRER